MELSSVGKFLVVAGLGVALVGVILMLAPRIPWLGHLPGDISIERGNFRFYFPLGTLIVVSVLLTIALNVILRLRR